MTDAATDLLRRLTERGWAIAVAESLTGGLLSSALVSVPGASAVLRGAVVAYATDVKRDVLGVDAELLETEGAVHVEVARQMAVGVRRLLKADVGVATTGVAGPTPQDGRPVGTVCVAVSTPEADAAAEVHVAGDRAQVRSSAVVLALRACLEQVPDAPNSRGFSHPTHSPRD